MLNKSQNQALDIVSKILGVPRDHLYKLIQFESRFNPQAKNPYSSARGLIQFTDSTAQNMGFLNSLDLVNKYPTIESQLKGPVLTYFKQYAPFPTKQSLYLSVFYPKYRNVHPATTFPKSVILVNPGIKRVSDYINKVDGKSLIKPVPLIILLMLVGYYYYKHKKKGGEKYDITENVEDGE